MSNTPPGWYDDGQGGQRWWDGSQWAAPGQGPAGQPPQNPQTPAYGQPAQPAYGQPQYGQPQYGQPGGPGSPAPKKKKTGLIIGIVVALVLIAGGIVAAILLIGGDDGPSADDPAETVQSYIDAGRDGDCDAAIKLLSSDLKDELGADCDEDFDQDQAYEDAGVNPDDVSYDVGEAEVDGDRATVPVTVSGLGHLTGGEDEITSSYELVKEDGDWLISSFGEADFGSGSDDSGSSTELPTPSGAPTDFELPSDLPTDFELPSDIPTDFGELPTDPADLESYLEDLQSQLESEFPTE